MSDAKAAQARAGWHLMLSGRSFFLERVDMLKKILVTAVTCMALSPAFATLTFTLTETGGNVVLTTSGSVNTTALTLSGQTACGSQGAISPSLGNICSAADAVQGYVGITGPASFGSGGLTEGTSASGDTAAVIGANGALFLPVGYTSGSPLSGTATFAGSTLASLGVTPGVYTWTFGSGASADSVVVIAGAPATSVPTLGEWALVLLAGLMGWTSLRALRRRTA